MNPEVGRNWDAVSMFEEEDQARKKAIERPRLGHYIAEVEIPENAPITCERTTTSEGHYSVRGDPELLLRRVVRVVPVHL